MCSGNDTERTNAIETCNQQILKKACEPKQPEVIDSSAFPMSIVSVLHEFPSL